MLTSTAPSHLPPTREPDLAQDRHLVKLWLHGRPIETQRAYSRDAAALRAFVSKSLSSITLDDLQRFSDSIEGSAATRARVLSSARSLLSFGVRIGLLNHYAAAALQLPRHAQRIGGRLLSESDVAKLIAAAKGGRDRCMLSVMYASGARVSEVCNLRWRDVLADTGGTVLAIVGKGSKERSVRLPTSCSRILEHFRTGSMPSDYVFKGRHAGMDPSTVWHVVRNAGIRAGLSQLPSPHWLRHAAASHSLAHGASIALVRDALGHSSVAVTSLYLHARPDDSLGQFLGL